MHHRLAQMGFRCVSVPAIPGRGKGTMGGVCVVAPKHIGLTIVPWRECDVTQLTGRAVHVHVGCMMKKGFDLFCVYTAGDMDLRSHWDLLGCLAQYVLQVKRPWIVAGDFNMQPEQVSAAGWIDLLHGVACHSDEHTCESGGKRCIDWFIVDRRLQGHVRKVEVQLDAPTRPHWPVVMDIMSVDLGLQVPVRTRWKAFPHELPQGCARRPRNHPWTWQTGETPTSLTDAYSEWLEYAELELCDRHDIVGKRANAYKGRSKGLSITLKPLDTVWKQQPRLRTATAVRAWDRLRAIVPQMRAQRGKSGAAALAVWQRIAHDLEADLAPLCLCNRLWSLRNLLDQVLVLSDADYDTLHTDICNRSDKEAAAAALCRTRDWRAWVQSSVRDGAGLAHKWCKGPKHRDVSHTAEVLMMNGAKGIDTLAAPWTEIWRSGERLDLGLCDKGEQLPRITLAELKACIKQSNPKKAAGVDSWSARSWLGLSDDMLLRIIDILHLFEEALKVPAAWCTLVVLLDKPDGTHRPVGLTTQIWKIWGRIRMPLARHWQRQHAPRAVWAMEGKSCLRAAWEAQLRTEAARADSLESAS
eukprot:6459262-Amphidinium_carterae.2